MRDLVRDWHSFLTSGTRADRAWWWAITIAVATYVPLAIVYVVASAIG